MAKLFKKQVANLQVIFGKQNTEPKSKINKKLHTHFILYK